MLKKEKEKKNTIVTPSIGGVVLMPSPTTLDSLTALLVTLIVQESLEKSAMALPETGANPQLISLSRFLHEMCTFPLPRASSFTYLFFSLIRTNASLGVPSAPKIHVLKR